MHGPNPKPLINKELYERIQLDEGTWKAFETDLKNSNIPETSRKTPEAYVGRDGKFYSVNQFQQALTQFAFVGFHVLFPERLSIFNAKDEDLEAFNHLWAVLGYALGIDDEYNIALQPDLKTTKEHYQRIYEEWYLPALFNLHFHSKVLMEAQLKVITNYFKFTIIQWIVYVVDRALKRLTPYLLRGHCCYECWEISLKFLISTCCAS